jgi:hypothetical protein
MQPSMSSAPRIASASAPAERRVAWGFALRATITVVEPVVGLVGVVVAGVVVLVVVVGTAEAGVLVVCGRALAGVVAAGATVPG